MKNEELMEYSKESLVNTIIDYQDQIIELKKKLERVTKSDEQNFERRMEAENKLEKYKDLAYKILKENGETFGY